MRPKYKTALHALLCITYNNSIFNNENYLQIDGTAQGPHMSCSYADIAMADFDRGASGHISKFVIISTKNKKSLIRRSFFF